MLGCCYCCLWRRRPVRIDSNNKMKNDSPKLKFTVATVVVAVAAAVVVVVVFIVAGRRWSFVSFVRYLMQTNYANRGCIAAARLGLSLEFEVRDKVT